MNSSNNGASSVAGCALAYGYHVRRARMVQSSTKILTKLDGTVERAVKRIRRDMPDVVGVFLCGSRLRGDSGPHSDLDFDALVPVGPHDEAAGWFDGPLRVSVWVRDVERGHAEPGEAS